jgi:eukaryotic-like serine/threonine-protein kinase
LSDAAQAATQWSAGRRVGPYRLVSPLGEGGMAEVWLAERDDGAFKRQVAIKLPYARPGRETFAVRFDRERDILATLRHPHIAGLYDAGMTADSQAWLALEYVEGQPISVFCDERRLSVRDRVLLFRQVLLAVQHAHANLVIHRDLKPANILVTPQGEARLLDFGIAKLLEAGGDAIEETELTRQAGRSMTPRYASPEQLTGLALTTATDVYSLGVVFYELISGERPYELKVESPAQLEHAILDVEPRAPSRRAIKPEIAAARGTSVNALRRTLAPELDAIALRCLAKNATARFTSVDALLADVDRWLAGEAVLARAPGAWYRFGKFALRHRLGVGLGVASVVALAGVAAVAVVLGMQAREESARATAARDFMLGLFQRADQEKARGADITARELLEAGRRDLASRLNDQPRLQAELLMGIGKIQMEMGEYANAESTFSEAVKLYSRLGMAREESRARVSHADDVLRMGNPKRAQALLNEALEVRGRPSNDDELEAQSRHVKGWIANILADPSTAKTAFVDARRHATAAHGPTNISTLNTIRGLVYAERQLRNYDEALRLQAEVERAASRSPEVTPKYLTDLDMDRAELLQHSGRYDEGFQHSNAALRRCAEALGAHHETCRRLLLAKLKALTRLGMVSADSPDIAALDAILEDRSSPALQTDAVFVAFRWHSMLGESDRQRALGERVRALGQSGSSVAINPALKTRGLLMLAESRLMAGDPVGAETWVAQAQAIMSSGSGPVPPIIEAVGKSLGALATLQAGDAVRALQEIRQAQKAMSFAVGEDHPLTMLFALNAAIALERLRRPDEALLVVRRAEPSLKLSFGTESPILRRVQRLALRLQSSAQNPGRTVEGSAQQEVFI